jgi:copper(I)-binding protein
MMRRPILVVLVAVLAAMTIGGCGGGDGATVGDALVVSGAWARTTPPGAVDGVAYLTIESPVDDRLLGASVPGSVAGSASIHESMLLDDGSEGHGGGAHHGGGETSGGGDDSFETTVELPAGDPVAFEPGGRHVMLVGLVEPLRAGATVPITLTLEVAGEVTVEAEVSANAP